MEVNGHAPPAIQLVITFDPATGSVSVSGPIENKIVAYGMLELAKAAIADYGAQKAPASHLTLLPPGSRLA